MKSRRWAIGVITGFWILLCVVAGVVYVVDPYFHFHAPFLGMSYVMEEEQYMNDGITRNFEYDAAVTGTSLTQFFSTSEIDELFGVKSVRLTFKGEGFRRINDNLEKMTVEKDGLKLVIRGIDTMWFIADANYMEYESYPEYLYDENLWNDVNYIFNQDIFMQRVIPQIARTVQGIPAKDFDMYIPAERKPLTTTYERPEKEEWSVTPEEMEESMRILSESLEKNVLAVIKDNPEIEFYLFFPPYSICWWDSLNQNGKEVLERRIRMEEYAIPQILSYPNVHFYSFFNNFDMICNLDNYSDSVHYSAGISTQLLEWMKNGEYELTEENYREYIKEIRDFYCNFDYDAFFEQQGYDGKEIKP